MKRKQFNVKDFVSNEETPVETRDGRKVRILCTDRKDPNYPIVGLVTCNDGYEANYEFTINGSFLKNNREVDGDLFFRTCVNEKAVSSTRFQNVLTKSRFYRLIYRLIYSLI